MADKIFHSTAVTFVDMTDERKLEIYISSNHPTTQLCNANKTPLEYTPDWSTNNLQLEANFYLDSTETTPEEIWWYAKIGTAETLVLKDSPVLSVTTNVLGDNPIITYICKAKYQNIEALKEITFTRVDTGLNGINAPAVLAQYSVDGKIGWTSVLNTATHKYIRYSYDGGKTWTTEIKIVGEDGTSVNIKGTATSKSLVSGTSYYTLIYNSATINGAAIGDAYLLDGNLYVCVDSRDGNDYFMDVGRIQGPQGNDGQSSYVFIRYATDANGSNMSASPNNTTTHIGICTVNTNVAPTTANSYTWSKYVGDNAKSIILNGTSQIFKVSASSVYSPTTITVTAQTINTTISNWEYSVNGGVSWTTTAPAGVALNSNTNTITITGNSLTSNSIVIKASNGAYSDTYTVYKVFDGANGNPGTPASMAFLTNENISFSANANGEIPLMVFTTNVVAYNGATKVTPTLGTITGLPTGMTVASPVTTANEQILTFSIANNSTLGSELSNNGTITIPVTSPVSTNLKLSWSKINTGATGIGISSTTVSYGESDSPSVQPTSWQSTIPDVAEGKYLWTRTIIDYTDANKPDTVTYTYAKQGTKGDTGNSGSSVTVSSVQYQAGTSATSAPTGTWSGSVVAAADGNYLWTKTTFSDGKVAYGVARQGVTGRGVSSIVEQYYQSTSATTQSGGSWSTTVPTWADGKYIWTRSVITYTDTTTSTTSPVCVTGQKGGTGGIGATGVGVSSVDVWYYQSTSSTALSGGSWSTTAPTWSDGKYVWTKTITTYTNSTTDETAAVCITGQKGDTGVGVKSVTEYYLATSSSSGVTTSTSGWTTAIQTISADKKYLWNYEVITYTNDTTSTTSPIIIGAFGNTGSTGATGKGIKSVTEYYLATTSSSGVTTSTTGWTTTMQTLTATNKYLWNYELITYTDDSKATISPVIIGVYGDKGAQGDRGAGISSVTVTYGTSTDASTQPTSWQTTIPTVAEGAYLWTRTVTDYTDASIADTVTLTYAKQGVKGNTGSAGTSVTVSSIQYQAGTSATTAPTGTWSNSVVTVSEGSYLWTKTTFSDGKVAYGVAKQGSSGRGISSITEYYLATTASTGVTTSTSGWTTTIQSIDVTKRYLWNYELITYTNNTTSTTTPVIIGVFGDTGKGIKSVTEYYLATASSSNVTTSTSGWTTTIQTLTASNKYLWNYEVITYTDNTTTTVSPVIIGVYGDQGVSAVSFQVYAPNGYLITKDLESLTLQTFAYEGGTAITSGATYQWAQYVEDTWENISGATTQTLTVTKDDVVKSRSYKCTMTYKSKQYTDTATVQDKTDIYDSLLQVITKYSPTNKLYWVLYSTVYSEEGERDKLLGSISVTTPANPTSGQYWYKIDETNYTVTLMKYSGTAWATTTDKQELVYDWSLINDTDKPISLGTQGKVKIITSSDFSKVCSVQCNIRGSESIPISYSNQILIDPSDPIVSSSEPTNPTHGQLWIKTGTNGLYTLLVWDASLEKWVVSETDSQVRVHISKPTSYSIGDVWVVGSDYEPTIYINGVAQATKHLAGTMLKAQYSSQSYKDSDWVEALNYKKDIDDLKDNLNTYNQFFSFDEDGLTMQAKNKSGVVSEFKTKLTNTELGFYQGENKVAHINNNQLNISKAEITNGMTIKGSAPMLEIGNFIIMQESNGSLSIGLKS